MIDYLSLDGEDLIRPLPGIKIFKEIKILVMETINKSIVPYFTDTVSKFYRSLIRVL